VFLGQMSCLYCLRNIALFSSGKGEKWPDLFDQVVKLKRRQLCVALAIRLS
jgi:hypothetical protein